MPSVRITESEALAIEIARDWLGMIARPHDHGYGWRVGRYDGEEGYFMKNGTEMIQYVSALFRIETEERIPYPPFIEHPEVCIVGT